MHFGILRLCTYTANRTWTAGRKGLDEPGRFESRAVQRCSDVGLMLGSGLTRRPK